MRILWKCEWETGDVSFVLARSRFEAVRLLGEIGEVTVDALEPVDVAKTFIVNFRACKRTTCGQEAPHWHASDVFSQHLLVELGDPSKFSPEEDEPEPAEVKSLPPAAAEPTPETPADGAAIPPTSE